MIQANAEDCLQRYRRHLSCSGRGVFPCHALPGHLRLTSATVPQASSGKGNKLWDRMHERIQNSLAASRSKPLQTSGAIGQGFVMPKAFPHFSRPEHRYEKFVKQVQAINPGAQLSGKTVDRAAQAIIERQCGNSPDGVARAANLVRQVWTP
jgi:hypothetical protein